MRATVTFNDEQPPLEVLIDKDDLSKEHLTSLADSPPNALFKFIKAEDELPYIARAYTVVSINVTEE